jgi:DNA-binding transcriptional ArsR family regulator
MVNQGRELDAVFRALADGARRQMLRRACPQELTVGEFARPLNMSLAAV